MSLSPEEQEALQRVPHSEKQAEAIWLAAKDWAYEQAAKEAGQCSIRLQIGDGDPQVMPLTFVGEAIRALARPKE